MKNIKRALSVCLAIIICFAAASCSATLTAKITEDKICVFSQKLVISQPEIDKLIKNAKYVNATAEEVKEITDRFIKDENTEKSVVDDVTYYTNYDVEPIKLSVLNEDIKSSFLATDICGEFTTTDVWAYGDSIESFMKDNEEYSEIVNAFSKCGVELQMEFNLKMPYKITKTNLVKIDDYTVNCLDSENEVDYIITEKSTAAWTKAENIEQAIYPLAKNKLIEGNKEYGSVYCYVNYLTRNSLIVELSDYNGYDVFEIGYKVNKGNWKAYKTVKADKFEDEYYQVKFKNIKANKKYTFRVRGYYNSKKFGKIYSGWDASSIKTANFKQVPKIKLAAKKKSAVVKITNKNKYIDGYEIRYSLDKKFKKSKVKHTDGSKFTIKKLKSGKTYYVKVRKYVVSYSDDYNEKIIYSGYSKVKKIKVK